MSKFMRSLTVKLFRVGIVLFLLLSIIGVNLFHVDVVYADAVDLYWFGGTGNWSDTAHWGTASGGAGAPHAAPTSTNKVIFDNLSDAGATTVTMNANASCADMDWSAIDAAITWTCNPAYWLNISGSLTLSASVTKTSATSGMTFSSTAAGKTITTAGVAIDSPYFEGNGGSWQLQDNFSYSGTLSLGAGTLDTNGKTLTGTSFAGVSHVGANAILLGASVWNLTGNWNAANVDSITCGTSSIRITTSVNSSFYGNGLTYNELLMTGNMPYGITGANTFATLTLTNTAKNDIVPISANQIVTGTFTATGVSATNRLMVKSNNTTQRTITAAVVTSASTDYSYIIGAGAGSWDLSSAGEDSIGYIGNSGITFTYPYNANEDLYWTGLQDGVAGAGTWSGSTGALATGGFGTNDYNWSTTSGGVAGTPRHSVPTATNNVFFDALSGFTVGNQTVTITYVSDSFSSGYDVTSKNLVFTGSGAVASPAVDVSGATYGQLFVYGNLTLITGMNTHNARPNLRGSGNITTAGVAIEYITLNSTGTYTMQDAITLQFHANNPAYLYTAGTLAMNGFAMTLVGTSTFAGGGQTYSQLIAFTGAGTSAITGANTFTNLTRTGTNTFTDGITFAADQVVTGTLTLTGYDGAHRLQFGSSVAGTQRQITVNGTCAVTNTNISDSAKVGTASPDISAGLNSDMGNNLGWVFTVGINTFWVGNTGNWSNVTNWASTSNGIHGSGRIPLIQDTAVFDAGSFSVLGRVVTIDVTNIGGINTVAAPFNPTITSAGQVDSYMGFNIGTSVWTVPSTYLKGQNAVGMQATGAYTFTTNLYVQTNSTYMTPVNFNSNFTIVGSLNLVSGVVAIGNYSVTAKSFDSSTTTYVRALTAGTGILTLNDTVAIEKWHVHSLNMSVYCGTSTIVMTNSGANAQSFTGAGMTYYNLTVTGAGDYTLTFNDANTWSSMLWDRSVAHKTLSGNFTQTITGNISSPTNGVITISIANVDISKASGTVNLEWLNFNSGANTCTAGGGATFYAGINSITAPQTGWNFTSPASPTVTTVSATNVLSTSATLTGNVTSMGGYGTIYAYFIYGVDPTFTTYATTAPTTTVVGIGTFTFPVTGLADMTTYYYAAAVGDGFSPLAYGAGMSFNTGEPAVVTGAATVDLIALSVVLNGEVTDFGSYTLADISVYFQYGTTIGYLSGSTAPHSADVSGLFTETITGLAENATYHYRAVAKYSATGYVYGADATFVTDIESAVEPDSKPSVNAVFVYEDLLETGDTGVLIDYHIEYTTLPARTATEAYLAVFIDTNGTTQLRPVAPYSFVSRGYGHGLIWIYFSAAETTTYSLDSADKDLYKVWLIGNPTLSWPADPPKTVANIDYWQTSGTAATLLALRVLDYAGTLGPIWTLATSVTYDLVDMTAIGNRLTVLGENYFENVIKDLRLMAPGAFASGTYDPSTENIDYSTEFGAIIDDDTGTVTDMFGGAAPVTLYPTYHAGLATFTNGSPAVVGIDTYWVVTMVGMSIQHTVDAVWYTISAITDPTHLTLSVNYAAAGGAAYTYTIQNIVDVTATGNFTVTLLKGTAGTIASLAGGGVVTDSPVNLVTGVNTITASNAGTGNIIIDVYRNDTATAQEDEVTGTGFDLTELAVRFGMTRWFLSGIVWLMITIVICAAVYGMRLNSGVGSSGVTKVVMLVFDFCIIGGALLGLLHPIVATLMFIGFGVITGYVIFYRQANF